MEISHVSSAVFIFKKTAPDRLFIEMKDDGYPVRSLRGNLNPFGGSWSAEDAADLNPYDTLTRELDEELTFKPLLGDQKNNNYSGSISTDTTATASFAQPPKIDDEQTLRQIKELIIQESSFYGQFLVRAFKEVADQSTSGSQPDLTQLVTYYTCLLDDDTWHTLSHLQSTFGNLSSEARTVLTDLEEMVSSSRSIIYGHDQTLQRIWQEMGYQKARELLLCSHPPITEIEPFVSYQELTDRYYLPNSPQPATVSPSYK